MHLHIAAEMSFTHIIAQHKLAMFFVTVPADRGCPTQSSATNMVTKMQFKMQSSLASLGDGLPSKAAR